MRAKLPSGPALLVALAILSSPARAQHQQVPVDSARVRDDAVTIRGERVPYRVTSGFQPVWGDSGKALASLFYIYYERTDVRDRSRRPLLISFNGGPGTASLWMHIGYTGPRTFNMDPEGFPVQPYGLRENPNSILDVTDIVYIDPVNTGFARALPGVDPKQFFGVNQDVAYLAKWLDAFVSRQQRWTSPKFLIGESYGTTRVSGLARRLQDAHWLYVNGVVLVSPTDLGIARNGPIAAALTLPHYAATAWYHRALSADLQQRDLDAVLPEVERFTVDEYIPALVRAGSLDEGARRQIATKVARYAGIPESVVLQNNLGVPVGLFRKELLRARGLTVGRLDARYTGIDRRTGGEAYDYDPALTAWEHMFTPAINYYLRDVLGWKTDLQYYVFGPVSPWDRTGDNTGNDLRQAMAENPYLHLLVQGGYYDGGTDYFSAKYTLWQLEPSGRLRERISFDPYRSGHMMYLRQQDAPVAAERLRAFIRSALPAEGAPAKY